MEWKTFAEGIQLSGETISMVEKLNLRNAEYERLQSMYIENHEICFAEISKKQKAPLYFLAVYCRMACDTYERYKAVGIAESIFWDTFSDVRIWCENYHRACGRMGIGAYDWLWRHIDMTILRLGRLQYEEIELPHAIGSGVDMIPEKSAVISIHIPQGEPLSMEACRESLEQAYQRYGRGRRYVCWSWLLYPGLATLLKPASNIAQFQKLFRVIESEERAKEAEERIFGTVLQTVGDYPENTSLQKAAKKHLLANHLLGKSWGVLLLR